MKHISISLLAAAALITISAGAQIRFNHRDPQFDAEQKIRLAERIIENFYVDTIDINKTVEEGIVAMLKTLDPHSTYTNAEETKEVTEPLAGNFSGVGISFNMLNDTLFVVTPVAGGPCEKVGMQPGDRIIWADDTLMSGAGKTQSDVRRILRGPKGTPIKLRVSRRGKPGLIDFRVVRDEIPIYSVDASYMATPEIGYIRLSRFAESTTEEFAKALADLKKKGMTKLIIDLESNGGGYMQPSTDLADMFLAKGDTIVYTKGVRSPIHYFTADGRGRYRDIDIAVLVDQNSASAAEILSGALQDNDRGVIIGRRTFGKGLVQRPFPFPDGSMVRLTTSRYYTPSGRSIQKSYANGEDEYRADIRHRLQSGELTGESEQVYGPDSLRYYTRNGRVVYGGGGISPDIFVPLDTTYFTDYYRDLLAKGIFNRYTLQYVDDNRAALKKRYPTEQRFIDDFNVTDQMLDDMRKMAHADSIKYDPEQFVLSRQNIVTIIKAIIGRDLFEPSTYYRIANPLNPGYRRALRHLGDADEHRRLLLPPL